MPENELPISIRVTGLEASKAGLAALASSIPPITSAEALAKAAADAWKSANEALTKNNNCKRGAALTIMRINLVIPV